MNDLFGNGLSYSAAAREIETILNEIETESIDIDVLAERLKRASYLIQFCKNKLRDTETEVKRVLEEIEKKDQVA